MGKMVPDLPSSDAPGGDEHSASPALAPPVPAAKRFPRILLNEDKRKQLLAVLSVGCSRRTAARWIGCAPSTISRAAAANPEFARQLAHAEEMAEIEALKLIGRAAQNERYWRAAAWFVERKNPDEFGLRSPGRYTESQLRETLLQVVTLISIEVPPEKYERIMQRIDALIAELLALDPPLEAFFTAGLPPDDDLLLGAGGSASQVEFDGSR